MADSTLSDYMDYKTTIYNIFSPRKNTFAVPNYQRAYSWEKDKHVAQFLKDLKEHPDSVAQYHYGHFLFERDDIDINRYWIIDGQQRMTTAIIFLSCIYSRLTGDANYVKMAKNLHDEYLISSDEQQKFHTVDYDNNFFVNLIIEGREDKVDTRSRKRIKEARAYLLEQIEKSDINDVLHWKDLLENAKITTDIVNDKAEAAQIFTFQNDRGKDLTNLEKLKAYLMLQIFLSCKGTDKNPNEAIGFIEKEFETIYRALEKINIANEDQVLGYHTTAFLPYADNSIERVKNNLIKQKAENHQKWIKNFVVELKRSFEFVIHIQGKRKTYSYIGDVLFLDQANSFPLLLKLFHYHENDSSLENIFRLIEIILFRLSYTTGNYYTNSLPSIAYNYSGKDLGELKSILRGHAKSGFQPYWNFETDFHKCLTGDYHYWGSTRYLLWKYENSLRDGIREPYMLFPEFKNIYGAHKLENTIDHWTPQNPYDLEYEKEFKEKYLNNIGNLVLSTRGRNASDSNNLPSDKSTYSTLISRQQLEDKKGSWGKEEIKNRQELIVKFAKHYWNPENV
ncbi:DUF262 domain-containing protein [Mucilaginibacter flavidus]|uniref:DUF262 domain-containing protein n=1 Tax=Mucilaginibacter flavidus TaxID=2949309 RepID=UPI002092107F|nr:DUF262 domain-containing protein [Mucilaginibacter flavidus]MCO5950738.1 DUF262 domain-containing HNH endonuclease family protein [Mucilaginibacter flavidus]